MELIQLFHFTLQQYAKKYEISSVFYKYQFVEQSTFGELKCFRAK